MTLCCPICKSEIVADPDGQPRSCNCKGRVWETSQWADVLVKREKEGSFKFDGFLMVKAVDCKDL